MILIQIAEYVNIDVPNMRETLQWYHDLVGERKEYNFKDYGINTYQDFVDFIHSNSYENVNKRDVTVSYLVENSI